MGPWQHSPAGVDERLVQLAHLFVDCRAAFFETADQFHWNPEPGSGAAHAAAELPSPDPAIAKPCSESGHRLIAEVLQTYLLIASGHLGGLASLYASGEVLFPPAALIRATVENCAHAMWVLGDDAAEPSENRLARAYLEELLSAEEAKKNAGRLGDKAAPAHVNAEAYYTTLKQQILDRFPDSDKDSLGKRTLHGQTLLNLEATVTWMYALTEVAGSNISPRAGSGVYGFLSNMTHPTLYPARQMRVWRDEPEHGHAVAYLHIDVGFAERQASAALAAFYNALSYVTSYFGWNTSIQQRLEAKIEKTMPTFFV